MLPLICYLWSAYSFSVSLICYQRSVFSDLLPLVSHLLYVTSDKLKLWPVTSESCLWPVTFQCHPWSVTSDLLPLKWYQICYLRFGTSDLLHIICYLWYATSDMLPLICYLWSATSFSLPLICSRRCVTYDQLPMIFFNSDLLRLNLAYDLFPLYVTSDTLYVIWYLWSDTYDLLPLIWYLWSDTSDQSCGSAFISSGSGSGSSILGLNTDPDPDPIQIRSQSGSRALMTKNWRKKYSWKKKLIFFWSKTTIYLSLCLHKERPSYRRSLQLSKEAIQQFKTWTVKKKFPLLWVIFALLDPDPDPLTRLDPDPIRCGGSELMIELGLHDV